MKDKIQTQVVWMIPKDCKGYGNNDSQRRVYGVEGIAPTIRTCGGGNLEPKVIVNERSISGFKKG